MAGSKALIIYDAIAIPAPVAQSLADEPSAKLSAENDRFNGAGC